MMAEDDIAFLLNRGKLVEPHENEQAEINTIVDKSSQGIYLSQCSWKCFLCFPEIKQNSYCSSANIKIFFLVQHSNDIWKNHILTVLIMLLKKKYLLLYNKRVIAWILVIIMFSVNFFCNTMYKFIRYFGIYQKEHVYSIDILCENSTSTMPVSRREGWVFSCLSSYV